MSDDSGPTAGSALLVVGALVYLLLMAGVGYGNASFPIEVYLLTGVVVTMGALIRIAELGFSPPPELP